MFTIPARQRRRVLLADLVSTAVFPLAITGSTAVVPEATAQLSGPDALGPWIVLAYNGLFAAALLLAGVMADRGNRTRFFAAGNLLVAACGIASALAGDLGCLVALRLLAGIGAAMCAAGGSSLILAVYPPEERRRVYGYMGAVLGSGLAMGPIVAQVLMSIGGWPLVFLAPAVASAIAAAATVGLPSLRSRNVPADFDRTGAVLFGLAIAAAVTAFGMGDATVAGWWGPALLTLLAVAAAVALVRVERRAPEPAIPMDLLRIPAYRAYALATGAFMGVLVVALAVLPQLGSARHLSATEAAVVLSLLTVPSTLLPLVAARLARRWARPLTAACLLGCAAAALLLQLTTHPAALLVTAAAIGLCLGLTEGVPDGQALKHVPHHRGGAGAGLFSTARMSLETVILAIATGLMTTTTPAAGLAVAGAACLFAAVVLLRPARRPATEPADSRR